MTAFMRMYENKFVSDKSAFVDMDKWDQCVHDELHPSHERQSIWIGIDASSKRDSTALVAVTYNKNTNPHTVRLIQHKVFTPPIDFEVIERVKEGLIRRGWTVANDSALAVLDAVPPAELGPVRDLVRRAVASGRAWVAPTTFEGRDVVRICATNGETTVEDVDALIAVLNERP